MYAHKDLQDWQAAWTMFNEEITCSQCAARQPSRLSNTDFIHSPTCTRAGKGQRPWEDLMTMLIVPLPQAVGA
ncbi:MAG: hypothetical protein ACRYF9_10240 [Janthinobacterium lividum]